MTRRRASHHETRKSPQRACLQLPASVNISTKENHYVKLRDDGYFKIHGVQPGEYDFAIQLFEQPAGCLIEAVGTSVVPVTITAEQISKGELKLETSEVECRSGPRPGSDMRSYRFANASGQVVSVNDLSGQH